jgi:alkyl hydroperoxide reductase subunit AhpC
MMHILYAGMVATESVPSECRISYTDIYGPAQADFSEMSLSAQKDAKKRSIIFLYPADFTFACAAVLASLAEQYQKFKTLGAEIITVRTVQGRRFSIWTLLF